MNTLIIGSSGKIGKFFAKNKKKNFYLTYFKTKIKNGIKFNILKDNLDLVIIKYNIKKIVLLSQSQMNVQKIKLTQTISTLL